MDVVFLIGRILFGMIFVLSGLSIHFKRESVEYARAYRAPAPQVLVPLSGTAVTSLRLVAERERGPGESV